MRCALARWMPLTAFVLAASVMAADHYVAHDSWDRAFWTAAYVLVAGTMQWAYDRAKARRVRKAASQPDTQAQAAS